MVMPRNCLQTQMPDFELPSGIDETNGYTSEGVCITLRGPDILNQSKLAFKILLIQTSKMNIELVFKSV